MQTRSVRTLRASVWTLLAGFLTAIPLMGIATAQDDEGEWYDPSDWFDDDESYSDDDDGYYDEGFYDDGDYGDSGYYDDSYYEDGAFGDTSTDWGGDTAWEDEFEETYGYEYWTDDDDWYDDPWYM